MYVVAGMWQPTHEAPDDAGAWKWCCRPSYLDAAWHLAQSAFPAARTFPPCGS
jgi:hypothetical protein